MASNQNRVYADRAVGLFTTIFLVCIGILAFALYLQHVKDLDPCPWCVVQRLAFIGIALLCASAIIIRPSGGGITFASFLMGLVAAGGIAAASYH
ncbi:MAG: disulfide bond formation protein B, partial [Burkholderiales bacterium]